MDKVTMLVAALRLNAEAANVELFDIITELQRIHVAPTIKVMDTYMTLIVVRWHVNA